jgi:hypothetical protein
LHADAVQREHDEKVSLQPLLQDECKGLSVALATKPDAPMLAREAAADIESTYTAPPFAGYVAAIFNPENPPPEEAAEPEPVTPQAAFLALVMSAFDCRFPLQPKPSIAWWAQVRSAGEELQASA